MPFIYFSEKRINLVYSTIYLTPKSSVFIELNKASVSLPLMLLTHEEEKGLCENCTCKDGGILYDPTFLQELDSLASKEYPIDFYTELFFKQLEVTGIAHPEFSTEENCPTKHIRWQNVQSNDTLESDFVVIRNVMAGDMDQMSQLNISVLELLLTLYDDTTKKFDTRAFSTGFFNLARNKANNSLIRKQMLKQMYINFRDIGYMSMVLEKGLV